MNPLKKTKIVCTIGPSSEKKEVLKLLSENGMLIKRPIVLGDDFALVGFKESEWGNRWQ